MILFIYTEVHAEITLDGTLGPSVELGGPNYAIGADLGQQYGGNLFHSFQDFNLQSHESATFSGPNNVQNVLSRVTGGNPSNIDGLIRSTMPNADMYFLNPHGLLFGPNARLDVLGGFHASTADTLRFEDGGQFNARQPSDSLLTVAPIAAFGFLTNSPASLSIEGSELSVPTERTLSMIGGHLNINQAKLTAPFGRLNFASVTGLGEVIPKSRGLVVPSLFGNFTVQDSQLSTSGEGGGAIYIRGGQFFASNSAIEAKTLGGQDGTVIDIQANAISLTRGASLNVNTEGPGKGADIHLHATDFITVIGENDDAERSGIYANSDISDKFTDDELGDSGQILLEAQNISFKEGAQISVNTYGGGKGSDITLKAADSIAFIGEGEEVGFTRVMTITYSNNTGAGDAGHLLIEAKNISFEKGAYIVSATDGQGNGGTVTLFTNHLTLTGMNKEGNSSSAIEAVTDSTGNAGNLLVKAQEVLVTDGAYLISSSLGAGNAGDVYIHATGTVTVVGARQEGWASGIGSDSNPREGIIGGEGGNVTIEAGQLIVKEGGNITASSIAPKGSQSSRGGNVIMKVTGAIELSGVNPYGENEDGFGAGIYARSIGVEDNAGEGGKIVLQAGSLTIKDGAVIKSSTNNNAPGGDIEIQVSGTINITGDATQIPLQAPADAQLAYLQDFSPANYNQSTSGIYARSEDKNEQAGQSGNITLSAQTLILTNKGKISTSSAGGGQAGNIRIEVNQLQLDNSASIASESLMSNTYNEANLADRDNSILVLGEIVEVADVGDGTAGRYINTGKNLIRASPVYSVADMNALYELPHQYSMGEGDVVEVRNAGDGYKARFVYAYNGDYGLGKWTRIDDSKATVSFDNMAAFVAEIQNKWYSPDDAEQIPYQSGEIISVRDAGDGKPATFIYAALLDPSDGWTQGRVVRINQFTVADMNELQGLTERTAIQEGGVALVKNMGDGTSSHFIYQDNAWIKFGNVHTVADTTEMNALTLAKTGNITKIAATNNRFIYSGQSWLPLNNTYQVENLAERDNLSVQTGDLVKVADAGGGKPESFLYVNGAWKRQIKGGDAGTITITTHDGIRLSNDSAITTEAISAGGGGITINADNLLYLTDGQITTSVEDGAGNGGDLTIKNPLFVVLDNGQIVAQAHEGRGGNIHITSEQYIASPNSLVSASSELGIDGEVKISSPDVDISGALLVLPADFVDASGQLKPPCTARRGAQNSFVVKHFAGSPPSPYDWQSSRLVLLQGEETPPPKTLPRLNTTAEQSALKTAFFGCRLDLSEPVGQNLEGF
jgi:filamentous hemagglutinin family protein